MHVKSTIPALAAGLLLTQGAMAPRTIAGTMLQWAAAGSSRASWPAPSGPRARSRKPLTATRIFTSIDAGRTWTDLMDRGTSVDANGIDWIHGSMIHLAGSIEFDPFDPKSAWVVSGNGMFKTSDIDAAKSVWKFDGLRSLAWS